MKALFLGLFHEQAGQQGELALPEMRSDADVLQAGTEFVANLLVEGTREFTADEHEGLLV